MTEVFKEYINGRNYQRLLKLDENFFEFRKFREGKQWPELDEDTAYLPRPVFNVCGKFVDVKKSCLVSSPMKMIFSPSLDMSEKNIKAANLYTDFASVIWKEIDQDSLNDRFLDDAATLGTSILHYYWDEEENTLKGEVLDPLRVIFGNPIETDVQKQPYIIIESLVPIENHPSYEGTDTIKIGVYTYVKVLTKYYREGKNICYDMATYSKELVSHAKMKDGFNLYPIVLFNWDYRYGTIYGIGEVEPIKSTQEIINRFYALNMLSVQDTAWSKWVVKDGALQQNITNEPGEVLIDSSPGNVEGVRRIAGNGIPSSLLDFIDNIKSLLQYTSGVGDVISGENNFANMSASAIMALQSQANLPLENKQNRLYRAMREVGKIWEQYFKYYYTFIYQLKQANKYESFVASKYSNVAFSLSIDVGPSSAYSEVLAQSTLDRLFYDAKAITLDDYIELCPRSVMPFKEELKTRLK